MAMGRMYRAKKKATKLFKNPRYKAKIPRTLGYKPKTISQLSRTKAVPTFIKNGMFVPEAYAEHLYSDRILWQDNSTYAYGSMQIRCNGMYDPDYSSTGIVTDERNGQTRLMDQMQTLYGHYRVVSSKIELSIKNKGTLPTYDATVFLYKIGPDQGDSVPTLIDYVEEHPNIKSSRQIARLGQVDGSQSKKKLTLTWNESELNLIDRLNNYADDAGNPADISNYVFGVINDDGLTTALDLDIHLKVTYRAVWSQPKYHNVST